jgi:hypothetical protein
MLQPYELKYSKLHDVNSFVNYIMLEVMLRANKYPNRVFNPNLAIAKYQTLINGANNDYVLNPLKKIFIICKKLKPSEIKLLKRAVHHNGKISALCDGILTPVRYEDINSINVDLAVAIRTFCDALYVNCLDIACFYNQYEKIDEYYKKLVQRKLTCQCCGVGTILNQFHAHRSALDHYLPKSKYPFVAVNFKNLIPICDTCNGKYKLDKDTLLVIEKKGNKVLRRFSTKAFYPFSKTRHSIDISIKFKTVYSSTIETKDLDVILSHPTEQTKVDNWNRIFGIEDNYKATCCSENMMAYYEDYFSALKNRGVTLDQHISDLKLNNYYDMNFLKVPFLEAIHR